MLSIQMSHRLIRAKLSRGWSSSLHKIRWGSKAKPNRAMFKVMEEFHPTGIDNKLHIILHSFHRWIKWTMTNSKANKWYMEPIKILVRNLQLWKWGYKITHSQGRISRYLQAITTITLQLKLWTRWFQHSNMRLPSINHTIISEDPHKRW